MNWKIIGKLIFEKFPLLRQAIVYRTPVQPGRVVRENKDKEREREKKGKEEKEKEILKKGNNIKN